MIKVVPFSQTSGSEKFKTFLALPFSIDMLYPVFGDKSCELLFEGWKGKNMNNWFKFTNDDKVVLEFYATYYTVVKNVPNATKYMLSIPKTIDDFINDMNRLEIQLYWTEWIDLNYEPKDYLHADEIRGYFENLLNKMGKFHELQ